MGDKDWECPVGSPHMTPATFKQVRTDLGLTQAQLAEALGVKPRTIWGLENRADDVPRLYALAVKQLRGDRETRCGAGKG